MMSPQRWWHGHLVTMLTVALMEQAHAGVRAGRKMTIKLGGCRAPAARSFLGPRPQDHLHAYMPHFAVT
jgi:hypothetical protein